MVFNFFKAARHGEKIVRVQANLLRLPIVSIFVAVLDGDRLEFAVLAGIVPELYLRAVSVVSRNGGFV